MQRFEFALHVPHQRRRWLQILAIFLPDRHWHHYSCFDDPGGGAQRLGARNHCPGAHYNGPTSSRTSPDVISDLWLNVFGSVCYHVALFKPKNN